MRFAIICVIAAGFLPQPHAQAPRTLDGRAVDPLRAEQGVAATALIFIRTDCPVANQAAPEIERVRALYADRGVRFWLVYVDPTEPADRIEAHGREYGLLAPAIRDPNHALVRRAGVHVTPEAAVYVFDGTQPRLTYRGRSTTASSSWAASGHARPDSISATPSSPRSSTRRPHWSPRRRPVARSRT